MSLANGCDGNLLQHFILISLIYDNFSQIEIKCCQKMGKYLRRNHLGNILLGLQVLGKDPTMWITFILLLLTFKGFLSDP